MASRPPISRPVTASSIRSGRPTSASTRPSTAGRSKEKTVDLSNAENHSARIRQIAMMPKTAPADREAMIYMVDAYESVDRQKKNLESKVKMVESDLTSLAMDNEQLADKVLILEARIAEYEKLQVVEDMLKPEEMQDSIEEINATVSRYSRNTGMMAGLGSTSGSNSGNATLSQTGDSSTGGNTGGRPQSPSQVAKQAEYVAEYAKMKKSQGFDESGDGIEDDEQMEMSEGLKILMLVQEKFKALEKLVFVLKKRVLLFESNEELMGTLEKYGSVAVMLEHTNKLQDENDKLRLREQRFHRDPLLRRRVCRPMDVNAVLPVLLMALQNELGSCYSVMDKFNMHRKDRPNEAFPQLPRTNAEDFLNIDDMLAGDNEARARPSAGSQNGAEDEEILFPKTEYDLMKKLNSLEYGNSTLRLKIERMEEERKLQMAYLQTKEEVRILDENATGTEENRLLIKEKKVAKLTRLNDALMAQIGGWETAIQAKEETVEALNEIISKLSDEKKVLADEITSVSQRCLALMNQLEDAKEAQKLQQERMRGLFSFAQSLALAILPVEHVHPSYSKHYIGFVYRDMLCAQVKLSAACMRIQKVLRGHIGRQLFIRTGKRRRIGLPVSWHKATAQKSGKLTKQPSASTQLSLRGLGPEIRPAFGYLEPLCKILLTLPFEVKTYTASPAMLRLSAAQVRKQVVPDVRKHLDSFAKFLKSATNDIMRAFANVSPELVDGHTQAGTPLSHVPHLIPGPHIERQNGPWVGAWAQPPIHVKKKVPTQVMLQTPTEEEWGEVDQPVWGRPGLDYA